MRPHAPIVAMLLALSVSASPAHAQNGALTPGEASRGQVTIGEITVVRSFQRTLPQIPGGFTFCRLRYLQTRQEQRGQGWSTDYPNADRNLTTRLSELTPTSVSHWEDGRPGFVVVEAMSPQLYECPFLFASDVGTASFDADEVLRLRDYFAKGGFLWADDFWGTEAWRHWAEQMELVFPDLRIQDLPPDHPLFSIVYAVEEVPQIPSIQYWRESGGGTSEMGAQSATPRLRAIRDDTGRILVLMSHNTDIADGWEREGEDYEFFASFSPDAYALGVNILVWIMTH